MLRKTLAGVLGFVLILGSLLFVARFFLEQNGQKAEVTAKVGIQIPDLELHEFRGKSFSHSQLGGKIYLVNFWATWCESCMVEMPSIIELFQEFKSSGFIVLAINVDANPNEVLPKVLNEFQFPFPMYVDEGQNLSARFNVFALPFSMILNKEGKVLHIETGERDWASESVKQKIKGWLQNS